MGEKECEEVKANYCTCKCFRCFIHHIVTSDWGHKKNHLRNKTKLSTVPWPLKDTVSLGYNKRQKNCSNFFLMLGFEWSQTNEITETCFLKAPDWSCDTVLKQGVNTENNQQSEVPVQNRQAIFGLAGLTKLKMVFKMAAINFLC